MLAWLTLAAIVATAFGQTWVQLPGTATHISAKANELWAVTNNVLIRWSGSEWKRVANDGAKLVAATSNGYAWIIGKDSISSWRWLGNPDAWNWAQDGNGIVHVNFLTNANGVAVNANGEVWRYQSAWSRLTQVTNALYAAIGDGNEIWLLDFNGNVHRLVSGSFVKQTANPGKYIDVQSATRVLLTGSDGRIYLYNGAAWTELTGILCKQATIGSTSVYCLDEKSQIWKATI